MKNKKGDSIGRYLLVLVLFAMAAFYILTCALQTMVSPMKEYWEAVDSRYTKENIPIEAHRGDLLSDDGRVLSTSLPEYRLYIDFRVQDRDSVARCRTQAFRDSVFENQLDSIVGGLARIFPDRSEAWFRQRLVQAHKNCLRKVNNRYPGPCRIYPHMATYVQFLECKKLPLLRESRFKGGFYEEVSVKREKPYGRLAARTLGELYPDSGRAKNGLELSYDSILRGKPGVQHRTKIRNRRVSVEDVAPENGHDLMTTIDIDVQDVADRALRNKLKEETVNGEIGMAMVMEVATGDVKAIVNLKRGSDGEYYEMKNHLVSDLMEPGSTFKTASIMVALEDGKINKNTRVDTGNGLWSMYGRTMRDHNWTKGGYGMLNVTRVLMKSSNIGVSRLIDNAYHNDPDRYVRGLNNLGVGLPLNLPFVGKGEPWVRHPRKKTDKDGKELKQWDNWYATALPWMSIGYEAQLPPVATLAFYNGIANNGRMVKPRFVTRELKDGQVVREFPVEVIKERMCSQKTLDVIHEILDSVVMNPEGLGRAAGRNGGRFRVSGKTGTAQVASEKGGYHDGPVRYMVSFCGYFPSEKPKYSCIVCIVKRGTPASGGGQCGPVFCEISQYLMTKDMYCDIRGAADTATVRTPNVAQGHAATAQHVLDMLGSDERVKAGGHADSLRPGQVPDVTGMGARDAVQALQDAGLKAHVSGRGRVVRQSMPAGAKAVRGRMVSLTLE